MPNEWDSWRLKVYPNCWLNTLSYQIALRKFARLNLLVQGWQWNLILKLYRLKLNRNEKQKEKCFTSKVIIEMECWMNKFNCLWDKRRKLKNEFFFLAAKKNSRLRQVHDLTYWYRVNSFFFLIKDLLSIKSGQVEELN